MVIGIGLFSATLLLLRDDYRRLETYKYVIGIGALALLVMPALPVIGRTVNGARLWVGIGSFQFQPGEFAKILLILFLAGYLREKREVLAQGRLKDFGPLLLIWGGAMAVLVQTNDLGSGLYFGVFLAMLYAATGRLLFVAAGGALFLAGAAFVYQVVPRVQDRVSIWLDPWPYARDEGYQLVQSLFAISFGGFGGTGLGQGTFSTPGGRELIPFLNTDFIYAALAHELGLVGISAVLLVYMLSSRAASASRCSRRTASRSSSRPGSRSRSRCMLIIVGGVVRLIPLTGITLPFVSYGGSSLLANFVLLACSSCSSPTGRTSYDERLDQQDRRLRRRDDRSTRSSQPRTGRRGRRRA